MKHSLAISLPPEAREKLVQSVAQWKSSLPPGLIVAGYHWKIIT